MSTRRTVENLFITVRGRSVEEREECARKIERSAKRIGTMHLLCIQVARDTEKDEHPDDEARND